MKLWPPQRPNLRVIIGGTRNIVNGATDLARSKTIWMFPEGETEYSVFSKILIGALMAANVIYSVEAYQYLAIAWWLNIFGIGAATEWVLNIGARIDKKYQPKANYWTFFGALIIYVTFAKLSGVLHKVGWQWAIFVAGCCYIPDAGSYIAGKIVMPLLKIKPTPIHPASPKKSWQALICGGLTTSLFFNIAIIYHSSFIPKNFLSLLGAIVVTIICTFAGAFGDMFESWTKREAGVKESSILLGPMGGFLDRIDSLLPTALVFVFTYWIFF